MNIILLYTRQSIIIIIIIIKWSELECSNENNTINPV
jgi:hypothetical protein